MNNTTKPELLPCPFCGVEPNICDISSPPYDEMWQVACITECSAQPSVFSETKDIAISDWNRRA